MALAGGELNLGIIAPKLPTSSSTKGSGNSINNTSVIICDLHPVGEESNTGGSHGGGGWSGGGRFIPISRSMPTCSTCMQSLSTSMTATALEEGSIKDDISEHLPSEGIEFGIFDTPRTAEWWDGREMAADCLKTYKDQVEIYESLSRGKKKYFPDSKLADCMLAKARWIKYRYGQEGDCCTHLLYSDPNTGINLPTPVGGLWCCGNPDDINSDWAFYCHDNSIMLCEALFKNSHGSNWPSCLIAKFIIHELAHACSRSSQFWEAQPWNWGDYGPDNPAERAAYEVLSCCPSCRDFTHEEWHLFGWPRAGGPIGGGGWGGIPPGGGGWGDPRQPGGGW